MQTQRATQIAPLVGALCFLPFLGGCASTPSGATLDGHVGPVEFALYERPANLPADAKDFLVRPGGYVDRNSMIVVDFASNGPTRGRTPVADETWTTIQSWLALLDTFAVESANLSERIVAARDGGTLGALVKEAEDFNVKTIDPLAEEAKALLFELEPELEARQKAFFGLGDGALDDGALADESVLLDDSELDDTAIAPLDEFLGAYGSTAFAGYSGYFSERLAERRRAVRDTLDDAGQVRVMVSAFADGSGDDVVRLHVRNYDDIQGASSTAPKNLGFSFSAETRERVVRELDEARKATVVLDDIDERIRELVETGGDLGGQLRDVVDELADALSQTLKGIPVPATGGDELRAVQLTLERAKQALEGIPIPAAADGEPPTLEAAREARDALVAFVGATAQAADSVHALVATGKKITRLNVRREIADLLQGHDSPLPDLAKKLIDEAKATRDKLKAALDAARDVPDEIDDLSNLVAELSAADADAAYAVLVPESLRVGIDGWLDDVGPWVDVVTKAAAVLKLTSGNLEAAASAVAAGDGVSLPRRLDDLREGLVELGSNVDIGDRVRVVVQTLGDDGEQLEREEFDFRVTWMGWRRSVRGEAIFVRGDSGPDSAQKWKPNVAAMASWHYRYRQPESGWGKFVNWLDPGLGVHAASVDLDVDEGAEFGLGVQLRFWDGLLFVGVGQDLSVDQDRTYYFVGTSLFKLLGALSD
ncbi:hypothetical protein [Engelhardtia mirabilis]|uniref:Uncharacterized protein n=1 Tax=Engelhardtia mirabilis TaxID=2528011 RepID=A0A518BI51_9BACT|nr:hypothetical protein Pla133_17100 [Planctomycetes bacterium Pla133]QDV00960.1 hypothetical protein Pla86_17090 [Planctomycetes bacterium Pla86]